MERPPATLKLLSGSCVELFPRGTKGHYVNLRQGAVGGIVGLERWAAGLDPQSIDLLSPFCLTPSTTARLTSCLLYASPSKPQRRTHSSTYGLKHYHTYWTLKIMVKQLHKQKAAKVFARSVDQVDGCSMTRLCLHTLCALRCTFSVPLCLQEHQSAV